MTAPLNHVINCVVPAAPYRRHASLVGKEPKLMGRMRNSNRISARLFALNDSRFALFTYSVDDVPACLYVCENIIV
jgi:hypothetical protein